VFLGLILATPNPVGERFRKTFDGNFDVQSGYADDRLAFWDVHWTMLKERPILGHGMNTDTAYRTKYYEELGLGAMLKKYEAHNMYLQMAVNGGLVGLAAFLAWLGWNLRDAWRRRQSHWAFKAAAFAWVALLVASVLQNSFQDSEVRYALTLLVAAQWLGKERFKAREIVLSSNKIRDVSVFKTNAAVQKLRLFDNPLQNTTCPSPPAQGFCEMPGVAP
jgi:O-antigen ligase